MTARQTGKEQALARTRLFRPVASALATLVLGACATAPDDARSRIGLTLAGEPALGEGDERRLLLDRTPAEQPVDAELEVSGDARPDLDYRLEGAERSGEDRYRVRFEAGESRKAVTLMVLDDSAAEATERLELRLLPPESPAARYTVDRRARRVSVNLRANDFAVTTLDDDGEGSLRQALRNANAFGDGVVVTFDQETGPFGAPQRIELRSPLPELTGTFTIEGFLEDMLWQASGVIVSGMNKHRVFEVAPGARIAIRNLTVTEGSARDGAGILNRGDLVVSGVTFEGNRARRDGGAVMNAAGSLYLVNSTLAGNHAGREGGALASRAPARVVHVTFSENRVEDDSEGAQALHSTAPLHLANSILWSGGGRLDCHADPAATPMRGHNLIGRHHDCGAPLLVDDPEFEDLNYFNGPARTIPLNGRSPAVNMADNSLSLDDDGKPLRWDQRGNGDPRFVAGYADLGAFEVQAFPDLRVNTTGEPGLRSCLRSRSEGCPLRSAVELALALRRESVITFDERALPNPAVITLDRPLPEIDWPLTLEAPEGVDVYVRVPRGTPLPIPNLSLQGVRIGTE